MPASSFPCLQAVENNLSEYVVVHFYLNKLGGKPKEFARCCYPHVDDAVNPTKCSSRTACSAWYSWGSFVDKSRSERHAIMSPQIMGFDTNCSDSPATMHY
jgi:hypothetical protein